ncbi:MAK10-like protein [Tanacetum coccineum]
MGDANPIRNLRDYSKPSHEGYKNTIKLPVGNNVVPLRSDTIGLVENGCSFHGLQSEDPNQDLKDLLKLMNSLDLNGENRERTRLRLFQFSLRNQARNWLERLPAGSITTWEDLTIRFLAQFFPPGRTVKLRNDILIRTIDQSTGGKLRDRNAKESWALLEDLALYDNESWNGPRDFAKPVKEISLPQDVLSTPDRRLIELKNQVQRLMEAHLAPMQPTQINKITTSCEICMDLHLNLPVLEVLAHAPIYNALLDKYVESLELGKNGSAFVQGKVSAKMEDPGLFTLPCRLGNSKPFDTLAVLGSCVNIIPLYLFKKLNIGLLEEIDHIFGLADDTKSYPVGIETARDVELNPFKDVLVFRRMVEFLGAIPINFKSNMWESEDLIKNLINWDKPSKNGDGAWHAKIRLIDPDGEEFTKTLQSIPTTRKLFERESPREIIDLDHFYDT